MDLVGEQTLEVMEGAEWYNKWLFDLARPYLGKEILEVGAGIGNFTKLLLNEGEVYAIDINESYIKSLNKKLPDVHAGSGNIETKKYFFKNKKFDTIICFNVLEHIENDIKALTNIQLLLKPKGKFILLVPAHKLLFSKFDQNLGHFRRYTIKEANKKLKNIGFNIIKIRYINWWSAIGWFIFLKLMKRDLIPKFTVFILDKFGRFLLWPEKFVKFPFGLSVLAVSEK